MEKSAIKMETQGKRMRVEGDKKSGRKSEKRRKLKRAK